MHHSLAQPLGLNWAGTTTAKRKQLCRTLKSPRPHCCPVVRDRHEWCWRTNHSKGNTIHTANRCTIERQRGKQLQRLQAQGWRVVTSGLSHSQGEGYTAPQPTIRHTKHTQPLGRIAASMYSVRMTTCSCVREHRCKDTRGRVKKGVPVQGSPVCVPGLNTRQVLRAPAHTQAHKRAHGQPDSAVRQPCCMVEHIHAVLEACSSRHKARRLVRGHSRLPTLAP